LIAASRGEGFGLPLIEAADHDLPLIARDIPVFREVAGLHAFYFDGDKPEDIAKAVRDWLQLEKGVGAPRSGAIPRHNWQEATDRLLHVIFEDQPYKRVTLGAKE
jgi:glycosyltransferase involved in cell wall biosynthesis